MFVIAVQIAALSAKLGIQEEEMAKAWDDFHAANPSGEIDLEKFLEQSQASLKTYGMNN
jgi:hypothetical protein